tara:strand:+ start:197 stop:736 length:540 start_codon:yes stop_codon:yes gene_type:complete
LEYIYIILDYFLHLGTFKIIYGDLLLNLILTLLYYNNYENLTMTDIPTKESILQSKFCINGKKLNKRYNKDKRWEMKNALRELNQKRLKNHPIVKKLKKDCFVENTKRWNCPHCKKEVGRLTSAHEGEPVSKIIDRLLDLEEYFPGKDLNELYSILRSKHEDIQIVICCDECNKLLEDN